MTKQIRQEELAANIESVISRLKRRGEYDSFAATGQSETDQTLARHLRVVAPLTDEEVDALLAERPSDPPSLAAAAAEVPRRFADAHPPRL